VSARDRLGKLLRGARPYAERLPFVAASYRTLRERAPMLGRTATTPLGFQFSGHRPMLDGTFEPDETKYLSSQLDTSDVFVDVGANIGYFTCLARARGVHAIAIEPLQSNLRALYSNVAANGWVDNVEVFPVAVGAAPALLELYGVSTGASLMPGWAGASKLNARTVPVSTLDILLGGRFEHQRLLVKIDVEGAEHQVLRGALRTLAREPRPRWLLEVCLTEHQQGINPFFVEVFETFWQHGYRSATLEDAREITRADVQEWVATGRRTFGSYSVVFEARSEW
jgi:FkbM family methyltransferase